jgi:hypothetical protein
MNFLHKKGVIMKSQTKVLSVCIIVLLIIYGVASQSHCENLVLSDASGEINQTVVFELTINNAPNTVSAMGLDLSYNPDILSFQSYEIGGLVSRFNVINAAENSDGIVRIGGVSLTAANQIQKGESGLLIKLSFNVLSNNSTTLQLLELFDHFKGWSVKDGLFNSPSVLPTITNIFPTRAYTTGGGELHITGTNYKEGVTISIGNSTQLTTYYDSASHIYCKIPSHEAGYATIIVANPDGNAFTLNETFFYEINPNQPSTIDEMNWITKQLSEQKILPPEDITDNERFGSSVAISDNFAIVGAKSDDDNQGSAYIFEKSGTGWEIMQKIVSESPKPHAYMGLSVAITDEFAFAGESCFDVDEENKGIGAVYVYQYQTSSGKWEKSQQLLPEMIEGTHRFGTSMSAFEDTLVVGAYGNTNESGKAFVFQRDGNQWNQVQCLEPQVPIIMGRFGKAVNIFSDYIIVGAYIESNYIGGAYIFQKIDGSWQQTTKLTSPEAQEFSFFGYSVDINNDFAIVGAYAFEKNDIEETGAVYIFKQTKTGWKRTTNFWDLAYTITENDLENRDKFGISLQLEGDILAVGATKSSSSDSGTVYFYELNDTDYTKMKELRASDVQIDARFGQSIALNSNHFIIGADIDNGQGETTGGVYFYEPLTNANHPPIIYAQSIIMNEDREYNMDLKICADDLESSDHLLTWTSIANQHFDITIVNENQAILKSEENWFGVETITFMVYDPQGLSATGDFDITVSPVNDPPIITDIPDQTIEENDFFSDIYLDNFVADVDDPDTTIIWTISGETELSVTIVDRIAKITVPYESWHGSETLTLQAKDPDGLIVSDTATFTVIQKMILIPPEDLSASETSNGIQLKWTPLPDFSTTYTVYRSQMENGIFYPVHSTPVSTYDAIKKGFIDTSIQPNVYYYYKVKTCKDNIESQSFSNTVKAIRIDHADFNLQFINPSHQILTVGESVTFQLLLKKLASFTGHLDIWCTDIPQEIQYHIIVNGIDTGIQAKNVQLLPATLDIHILSKSSLLPGDYHFRLQCVNLDGTSGNIQKTWGLDLTVIADAGIFVDLSANIIHKRDNCIVYGSIYPPLKSKPVLLTAFVDQQAFFFKQVYTEIGGIYSSNQWIDSFEPERYTIQASWTDPFSNKHLAQSHELIIEKISPQITCLPGQESKPSIDQDFSIKGLLSESLAFEPIVIKLFSPDGINDKKYTTYTDINGQFHISKPFFNENGLWTFKAYFMGNDIAIGCESDTYEIMVGNKGCAILVGGGQASSQNTYWDVTRKLITEVYKDFKYMGFSDDMIHLMINSQMIDINNDDIPDEVVDTKLPTADALINIIENEYTHILNANDTLYIYMQGHGTKVIQEDGAIISKLKLLGADECISSTQLNDALSHFQNKTDAKVVLIIESCYSGHFIKGLSHSKRIVITSAGDVPYNTDASGQISLSRYLFSRLRKGDSIQKAFEYAYKQLTNKNFPPPLLDDNGDGLVTMNDGIIASLTFLPGKLRWGHPEISKIHFSPILDQQTSLMIKVSLENSADQIEKVWTQVIPPDAPILSGTQMIHFAETELSHDKENTYIGSINNFSYDGIYTVLVYAQSVDNEVSDPEQLIIRVTNVGRKNDFDDDGQITLMDMIYVLQSLISMNNDQNVELVDAVYLMQVLGDTIVR